MESLDGLEPLPLGPYGGAATSAPFNGLHALVSIASGIAATAAAAKVTTNAINDTAGWAWGPPPCRAEATEAATASSLGAASTEPAQAQQQQQSRRHVAKFKGHTLSTTAVLCGAVSRTAAQMAVYPLDTVKTRKQVSVTVPQLLQWREAADRSRFRLSVALPAPVALSAAVRPRVAATLSATSVGLSFPNWAAFGPGDLFRGAVGSMVGIAAASLVFFVVDDTVKGLLRANLASRAAGGTDGTGRRRQPKATDALTTHMLSSAAASLVSAFVKVPSDVLKHKVQAYVYPSVQDAARGVVVSGRGARGLFAGFQATLIRDVPEAALQFTAYAQLRKAFCSEPVAASAACSSAAPSSSSAAAGAVSARRSAQHMLLGGAAGVLASVATTPLDVVKTKMQCDGCGCLVHAIREAVGGGRGVAGLFAGAGPRVMMTGLQSALFFTFFELTQAEAARFAAASCAAATSAAALQHASEEEAAGCSTVTTESTTTERLTGGKRGLGAAAVKARAEAEAKRVLQRGGAAAAAARALSPPFGPLLSFDELLQPLTMS